MNFRQRVDVVVDFVVYLILLVCVMIIATGAVVWLAIASIAELCLYLRRISRREEKIA